MKIKISDTRGNDVTCTLNESEAAHALERMLPLKTSLSDYASNEKGFMPPKKINVFGAPLSNGGTEVLAYYRPWNVVMLIYGGYSEYDELYELGMPVAGQGQIRNMKGEVLIEEIY
ncbi:cyclophilin-like fold protein [Ileibacterium valens]|uniref:cyclophilin-like fold protein n=1 Tax=Ileibacterium valens TaxID=1862668 RepID=UPI0023552F5F|nr:cyclophilin-like fold protein [Ileibacterium valens]